MNFPAVQCIIRDPRVRGHPLQIYFFLLPQLDLQRWTPVKRYEIEHGLHIARPRAREGLKRLVDTGYLERGERSGPTEPYPYRLVYACPVGFQIVPPRSA